jgi:CBS domain containing-hemolysin-like protein
LEDDSGQGLFSRIKSLIRKRAPIGNSADLAEEIHELMDEGEAKGLISHEESHMVSGVLDLKETTAQSIMIPRTEISSASVDATTGELIKLVTECGHTRIPIHSGNIDEIVGILHAKDLLRLWGKDPASRVPPNTLRKPYFVPETQKISELLREMKERKTHLAVATDEYGGTAGIITIEDILEEIVGEIMDEHDTVEPLLTVVNDRSILVDARLEIEKLEEHLNVKLPKGVFESVGGFIIHLLGRLPEKDETIAFGDLEFIAENVDERKIDKILIKRKARLSQSGEESHP